MDVNAVDGEEMKEQEQQQRGNGADVKGEESSEDEGPR